MCLFRGQKIQTSIERLFRIWKERHVYNTAFLKELEMLIEPVRKTQVNEALPDFKVCYVIMYSVVDLKVLTCSCHYCKML